MESRVQRIHISFLTVLISAAVLAACASNDSSTAAAPTLQSQSTSPTAPVATKAVPTTSSTDTTSTTSTSQKTTKTTIATRQFVVTSSAMVDGGTMPAQFTCDGASMSPPLSWSGAPEGTRSFAVLMDHQPGPGDWRWYWTLWGISASTTNIAAGTTGGAIVGTNSVNRDLAYAPPCSKGPGPKPYTLTVFALSGVPAISNAASIDRTALLAAVDSITLAKASMTVTYTRP